MGELWCNMCILIFREVVVHQLKKQPSAGVESQAVEAMKRILALMVFIS